MKFINAAFVSALAVIITGAPAPRGEAAPLPTNVAAMKASLNEAVVQVRYGGWRGGWGGVRTVTGAIIPATTRGIITMGGDI